MRPSDVREISYDNKNKVKSSVKDNYDKLINFFEKGVANLFKPKCMLLNTFICSIMSYFEHQQCSS